MKIQVTTTELIELSPFDLGDEQWDEIVRAVMSEMKFTLWHDGVNVFEPNEVMPDGKTASLVEMARECAERLSEDEDLLRETLAHVEQAADVLRQSLHRFSTVTP